MCRMFSLRHAQLLAVIVVVGAVLSVTLSTGTAGASVSKSWSVTTEFAAHKRKNPIPDKYKHPEVWSWMYGEADTPSSYLLMEAFTTATTHKRECGPRGIYQWSRIPNPSRTLQGSPMIQYNAGPTIERGRDRCGPFVEYPTKTIFMHPDIPLLEEFGEHFLASVVRWKSPITGVVTVSGSVQPMDTHVEGIAWQLDQGSTILLGPTEQADDSLTPFGPMTVSINAGESLYLDITRGNSEGSFDTTAATLNITS